MAAMQNATFYAYQNVSFIEQESRSGTVMAYQNVSFIEQPVSRSGTVMAYQNIGLLAEAPQVLVRQPRGWGYIPSTSQTVLIMGSASTGTTTAYQNIVE